jgi:hypothetical protein
LNLRGDLLTVRGKVSEIETSNDYAIVHVDMEILNQSGVNTCPAAAVVAVPLGRGVSIRSRQAR